MSVESDLEFEIDYEDSACTDWVYLEKVLERLDDAGCLSSEGKKFRQYIWCKYVKVKE